MKHVNNGNCDKCDEVLDRYPGFHEGLRLWFKAMQKKHPDAHTSCGGRGKADQEDAFIKGTSRAHYGQSAHNYNLAIDIFRLTLNGAEWPRLWFRDVVGTAVIKNNADPDRKLVITWYGMPGSKFFELPHCEVESWKSVPHALVELA